MIDPKRESENAQEVQEITTKNAITLFANIPEDMQQKLKKAASDISGIPAEELAVEQVIEILGGPNPNPELNAEIDRLAKEATRQLFDGATEEQWAKYTEIAQNGTMGKAFALAAEILARQTQEVQDVNKSQPITMHPPEGDPARTVIPPDNPPTKTITPPPDGIPTKEMDLNAIADQAGPPAEEVTIEAPPTKSEQAFNNMVSDYLESMTQRVAETFAEAVSENSVYAQFATGFDSMAAATEVAKGALQAVTDLINSPAFQAIRENIRTVAEFATKYQDEIAAIADAAEEIQDLAPFLAMELEDRKNDPAFANLTLRDLLEQGFDADGDPTESPFRQIIERAKQRQADFEEAENAIGTIEETAGKLERIKYTPTKRLDTITDKLTNVFYSLTAPEGRSKALNGQRQMIPLKYEGAKSKKEITLFYDYVYDEDVLANYGLSKKFDDFDFFVMTALDNLFEAGNTVVSLTKIYTEMGNENSPNPEQLEPILNSIRKGMSTVITINDMEVQKAWNKAPNGKYHEISSPVIPVQLGTERFIVNGKASSGFVKILAQSPFLQVAAPLGHLTAWDKEILRLYKGRKTKRYYSVMRFLMLQIGWMRNGKSKRSNKILYSALYDYTGDKGTRSKQLSRDMMYRLLDEVFKPAGYVTAYKEEGKENPGVILTINKARKKLPE